MRAFSAEVKDEILQSLNTRRQCDACLSGMLLFGKQLSENCISLITESGPTAAFFAKNLSRIAEVSLTPEVIEQGGRRLFAVSLTEAPAIQKAFDRFSFEKGPKRPKMPADLCSKQKLTAAVVAGAFLVCGSVNDPNKPSHLEFVLPNLDLCNDLGLTLIESCSVLAKQTERGRKQIVYLKDSESIQDLLIFMGASDCALRHITVKVDKEGSNRINRSINCTYANMKKLGDAVGRQIEAINILTDRGKLDSLPPDLVQIAKKRLEHPDLPLSELCSLIEPPVSRSALNRKLCKLVELSKKS